MSTSRRQTNIYPAYEIDLSLDAIKATVTVRQFTKFTLLPAVAGSRREIPGASDFMIDTGNGETIHVNEVRNMNGTAFPPGAVFQSLDDRVFFSKSYFDEMNSS